MIDQLAILTDIKGLGIEIHIGKIELYEEFLKNMVARYQTDRVMFGGLTKQNLSRGKWRFLIRKEGKFKGEIFHTNEIALQYE